jgi:hypothetical protein
MFFWHMVTAKPTILAAISHPRAIVVRFYSPAPFMFPLALLNVYGVTSTTVGACRQLAFQSLSVALQTANPWMLRSRKAVVVSPLSFPPQLETSACYYRDKSRKSV